ncbi:hypothetical protein ANCCAN_07032 [Ancylostoma caninum]|uniref:Major facilitator superfamily (MFS) profile domain-containing protein n=1 Tax=Ancylostoma caninum TaxID=29170 RepID=A0A368GRJ4_ANCCA|nr:hypothetical protein ANCCAN_07032 [Ancylostoma caninum]
MHNSPVGYKEEQQSEVSTPWKSIYITSFCAFLQAVQFTMFLSSMWPYFRKLNPNVQETEFGVVTAWYSFGTMMSAIIFGYWSNQIKQVRLPLLICFLLMMMGNLIYAALQFAPAVLVGHVMMTSRLITGCGIGSRRRSSPTRQNHKKTSNSNHSQNLNVDNIIQPYTGRKSSVPTFN